MKKKFQIFSRFHHFCLLFGIMEKNWKQYQFFSKFFPKFSFLSHSLQISLPSERRTRSSACFVGTFIKNILSLPAKYPLARPPAIIYQTFFVFCSHSRDLFSLPSRSPFRTFFADPFRGTTHFVFSTISLCPPFPVFFWPHFYLFWYQPLSI